MTHIKWIIGLTVAGMIFAAVGYVVNLNNNLNDALTENKQLTSAIEDQQEIIIKQTVDVQQIKEINSSLNTIISRQQKQIRELDEKFNITASGESRDLGKITRAKPGLVNKIVNSATDNVNRCFELASGAELKEEDLNNGECKDLIESLQ